ncbi:hypothetical protein AcV7_005628 [Taiwanofungus camphoratus]|nr:hypothetical protein AcV7_005628 [Antrodia cinnamomea]
MSSQTVIRHKAHECFTCQPQAGILVPDSECISAEPASAVSSQPSRDEPIFRAHLPTCPSSTGLRPTRPTRQAGRYSQTKQDIFQRVHIACGSPLVDHLIE